MLVAPSDEYSEGCSDTVFIASLRVRRGWAPSPLQSAPLPPLPQLPMSRQRPARSASLRHHHHSYDGPPLSFSPLPSPLFLCVHVACACMMISNSSVWKIREFHGSRPDRSAPQPQPAQRPPAGRPASHRQASPQQQRRMQPAVLPSSAALSHGTASSLPCELFHQCDCVCLLGGTAGCCVGVPSVRSLRSAA